MGVKRLGNSQSPSKVLMIEKCDDEARATGVGVENFAFKYDPEAADVRDKTLCKIYPAGTDCLSFNWKPSTNSRMSCARFLHISGHWLALTTHGTVN